MVCLVLKPGAAGRKAQTNPLSYGGVPKINFYITSFSCQGLIYITKVHKLSNLKISKL